MLVYDESAKAASGRGGRKRRACRKDVCDVEVGFASAGTLNHFRNLDGPLPLFPAEPRLPRHHHMCIHACIDRSFGNAPLLPLRAAQRQQTGPSTISDDSTAPACIVAVGASTRRAFPPLRIVGGVEPSGSTCVRVCVWTMQELMILTA